MESMEFDFLDLSLNEIGPYDYEYRNQKDDFPPIIRNIANEYDLIVFATPIYWYAMSGLMKNFFDRLSDCIRIEKETGRKLRGKQMAAICCGSDDEEIEGYFVPFRKSAEYLGMTYVASCHTWISDELITEEVKHRVNDFAKALTTNNV